MSTDRQRDADLDRLLRTTLRREPAAAPGACPDAGMLAALVEGGATADERASLEAHVASCGRCQDTLAAMDLDVPPSAVREAAPAAAPSAGTGVGRRPWVWRGHLHWLLPVGAAAALVVYIASRSAIAPGVPEGVRPEGQLAESRAAAPATEESSALRERPAIPQLPATPAGKAAPSIVAPPPAAPVVRKPAPGTAPAFAPEVAPAPSKGERTAEAGNAALRSTRDSDASKRAAPATAAAPQAAAMAAPPPAPAVAAQAGPPAPGAAGLAPDAAATKSAARAAAGELSAGAPLKDIAEERVVHTAAADLIVASAPGGAIKWRVGPEGAIFRSADEGRSWYPQKSGVKAALLAAAAPSVSTCWAVGASGTVLLTDDGERWERRPFPERIDLVAVDARSAHEAVVTTRDGRRFATTDRGATWTLQRHLP